MMEAFIEGLENVDRVEHNATFSSRPYDFQKGVNYQVNPAKNSVTFIWQ
jgi:hypothetical protein